MKGYVSCHFSLVHMHTHICHCTYRKRSGVGYILHIEMWRSSAEMSNYSTFHDMISNRSGCFNSALKYATHSTFLFKCTPPNVVHEFISLIFKRTTGHIICYIVGKLKDKHSYKKSQRQRYWNFILDRLNWMCGHCRFVKTHNPLPVAKREQ